MAKLNKHRVIVGQFGKVFGIKGWIKVNSFTLPKNNILQYLPWQIQHGDEWRDFPLNDYLERSDKVIVQPKGCHTPEQASIYTNAKISIFRDQLPILAHDIYYWTDLIGLSVINEQGILLGTVQYLFETGANDVLVIRGNKEHLIPYVRGQIIKKIDLTNKCMHVDWDADF